MNEMTEGEKSPFGKHLRITVAARNHRRMLKSVRGRVRNGMCAVSRILPMRYLLRTKGKRVSIPWKTPRDTVFTA